MKNTFLRMDTIKWIIVAMSIVVVLLVSGCGEHSDASAIALPEYPSIEVEAEKALRKKLDHRIDISGTVESESKAILRSKVMAQVASVDIQVGQKVGKGDRLVRLAADEIIAQLEQAGANEELALIEYERVERLREKSAATEQDIDHARLQAEAAKAALESASTQARYLEIVAPFKGVVNERLLEVGDMASPGSAVVALYDPEQLRIAINIPESLAAELPVGKRLLAYHETSDGEFEVTVAERAPASDPRSRTVRFELSIADPEGFSPGQRVRVFLDSSSDGEIWIRKSAVVRRGQLDYVFRITDERAWMRLVRIGNVRGDFVSIQSGLAEGDLVVISDPAEVSDGQTVKF